MEIVFGQVVEIILVGVIAGLLGGLLGIGGSAIMIPGLVIAFRDLPGSSQHLFQASAMAVNFAVAVPAAIRHTRAGVVHSRLLQRLLPVALVSILGGVALSNQLDGLTLRGLFGAFLLYIALLNIIKAVRNKPEHRAAEARTGWARCGVVGLVMGGAAGLLGIGGGLLTIPLIQMVCRVPLKQAIGVTSAAMCLTAAVGATYKIATVGTHNGFTPMNALQIALITAPTAIVGSWFGAAATHKLPTRVVRVVLIAVLLFSAFEMLRLSQRSDAPATPTTQAPPAPLTTQTPPAQSAPGAPTTAPPNSI